MKQTLFQIPRWLAAVLALTLTSVSPSALAAIVGIPGPTFNLTAKAGFISTGDGNSVYAWGYADGPNGVMQYPGPTLIVNQGDNVTVNLSNTLPVPVSIVFPGQTVTASGGNPGLITRQAAAGNGTVSYTFTATQAGTYHYHSGTQPSVQIDMGLVGALIVRPSGAADPSRQAYSHPATAFDHEYLFLLTEMDLRIHEQLAANPTATVDTSAYKPVYWFVNGRTAPDTMLENNVAWLPSQPYNSMPRMHPGEKLLMRVIGGGRDLHPFHTHGNNFWLIARDGRLLESAPGAGPDLAASDFTLRTAPGETYDAIYEWTGKGLGWDIYGTSAQNPHTCAPDGDGYDFNTREWCADHDKPIPVVMPNVQDITPGGHYSGSPYLGMFGALPPGQTVLNQNAGYFHMWHSHNEKEIVNNDLFPGGMMTMLIIEPPGTPIQ